MPEYDAVRDFEKEIADFAGSKYAVALESCTSALFLSCFYLFNVRYPRKNNWVHIPRRTYVSVPWAIIHAGGMVCWTDEAWSGVYQLRPYPIYDSAKRFQPMMYIKDSFYCLSFHFKKRVAIGRGGMILTDDKDAYDWFKRARFDGRNEKPLLGDCFDHIGWNFYMTPEQAVRGLSLFHSLTDFKDIPETPDYPDLSKFPIFSIHSRENYK